MGYVALRISRRLALLAICIFLTPYLATAQDFDRLLKQINSSVVTIYTDNGQGSGFFIDRRGYIATCYHVVDGTSRIRVETGNGVKYSAQIVSEDRAADLAIIRLLNPNKRGHYYLPISTALPEIRSEVIVLGTPEGVKFLPTIGVILGYNVTDNGVRVIQISRVSSFGSSGSPVVTRQGKVVGVVKAGSKSGDKTYATQTEYLLPLVSEINSAAGESKPERVASPARSAQAYFNLGVEYDKQNRYEEAIEAYKKAIGLNPRYPRAYGALGALWLIRKDGRKNEEQAIKYLEKAVQLDPNYVRARYLLGIAYFKIGDVDGAVQQCNSLRELSATQPEADQRAKSLCKMVTEDK